MKIPDSPATLREWIKSKNFHKLQHFCEDNHPAAVAEEMAELSLAEIWEVLRHAPAESRAEIMSHFDVDLQVDLAVSLPRGQLARIIADMPPDDRVDLFKNLPEESRQTILPALAQAEREDIRRLASYKEGTAGAVMTSDYATLPRGVTAAQAIECLRVEAPDKETIYYSYVLDQNRKLVGFVSLRDLILANPGAVVDDIMNTEVISVKVDDDQEYSARTIQKYDLLAIPVVDAENAIVGIVTHDDALDIITQEQTEDLEKLMAIGGSHDAAAYMRTSPWQHFKNRVGWLIGLAALGLVSGAIVHGYEELLVQFAILATFMPMLADTGGNTGSQSATLVVRALAIKEITPNDLLLVVWREFLVALPMGLLLAVLAFGRVILFAGSIPEGASVMAVGLAVGIALGAQVVTSTIFGALLPMGAAKLKLDPALVASPALTTVVDISGLLIYFTTARIILGI